MDDVLTDIPPPSRFFEEDLNIFTASPASRPTPFLELCDPYNTETLRPSLIIFAMSPPSLYIFHHASSKKLIGTVILPEIPPSGNSTTSLPKNKSCDIYALNNTEKLVLVISVEFHVPSERCHSFSKLLLTDKIVPERVLILDSIQIKMFRGRLSKDDTVAYKLETSLERKRVGESTLLRDMDYFPSGSVVDGLAAALLSHCQIRNLRSTLCVSWPQYGKPVMNLIRSLLVNHVVPDFDFTCTTSEDENLKSKWLKDPLLDSDMYI